MLLRRFLSTGLTKSHNPQRENVGSSLSIGVNGNGNNVEIPFNNNSVQSTILTPSTIQLADISDDEYFSFNSNSTKQWEDMEIDVLPKKITTRQEYKLAAQTAEAKADGCGPQGIAASSVLRYLQSRSGMKHSLSNTYVTLFNFHTTEFAEKLIKRNVGKVVIAETAMHYSKEAKVFARSKRKSGATIEAWRADQTVLFGMGRSHVSSAPKKLLATTDCAPFELKSCDIEEPSPLSWCVSAPIVIATFPSITQQMTVIDILRRSLLTHLCRLNPDINTLYHFGPFELITFLSTGNLASILCGVDPLLVFSSHSHRRMSALLLKLFDISPLKLDQKPWMNNFKELRRSDFHPPIPPAKTIAHEKKMKELGFSNGRLYGISIRPKRNIQIGNRFIGYHSNADEGNYSGVDVPLERDDLLKFAFFLNWIGKNSASKKTKDVIGSLCPESGNDAIDLIGKEEKIGVVPTDLLEDAFLKIREEITVPQEWIDKEAIYKA